MMKFIIFLIFSLISELHASDLCLSQKMLGQYKTKYAKGFEISYFKGFKKVKTLLNNDEFLILDKNTKCASDLYQFKSDSLKVIMTSTTYLHSLVDFNLEDRLIGFAGKRYIVNEQINQTKIKDLNYELEIEGVLSLRADVVLAYEGNLKKISLKDFRKKYNVPIVLNYDYKEEHPLARLEWSVFNALFWNREKEAITLFEKKAKAYEALKIKYAKSPKKKILVGSIENASWATPGALSDFGILIKDAGGELVLDSKSAQTQFLTIESVVGKKAVIDYWLTHNNWKSKKEFAKDSRYFLLKKIKTFNNNKRINKLGFNDFWESAQNHPEILLEDLHNIFNGVEKLYWYQEL